MTREEAVGVIERLPVMSYMKKNQKHTIITTALDMAIEALREPERKWIPTAERLPNNLEHDWVLAQVQEDNGYMWIPKVMEYRESKDDWFYDEEYGGWLKEMYGDEYRVIAWQPLPEPYKAGEQE